ncbi:hypothetical protein E05_15440 [Plautia stali symbiont]|nr:hypothetical protein E05_15440 [Plautia stali symbiont]
MLAIEELDQAKLRIVRAGAHEFGIQRHGAMLTGLLAYGGQLVIVVDQGVIHVVFLAAANLAQRSMLKAIKTPDGAGVNLSVKRKPVLSFALRLVTQFAT